MFFSSCLPIENNARIPAIGRSGKTNPPGQIEKFFLS